MKFLLSPKTASVLIAGFSFFATTNLLANSCQKADIEYYLQRGFTHDQVVRLCSTTNSAPTQAATPDVSTVSAVPQYQHQNSTSLAAQPSVPDMTSIQDQVYFETVLIATSAKLSPESLSYVSKECVEYGDAGIAGLRSKACANTKVTLPFNGLQVVRATKGIFLFRQQELLLRGNIQREYLNLSSYSSTEQAAIRAQLPENLSQLDLPVRKGVDPRQVAARLQKYIR